MNTHQLIGAISADLKRIAQAYQNNSTDTAERFIQEVLETQKEINTSEVEPYIQKIIKRLDRILTNSNSEELAEDALTYSTILQNYYVSRLNNK